MGRPESNRLTIASAPERGDVFPIVGLGASAGGLDALEAFFGEVPSTSGRAFVVVQHLDPNHAALLVELLQRVASMPVVEITDGLRAAMDHIYVIPPNFDLSIREGVLHLSPPAEARGLRLPIDSFFRSLADDAGGRAIAVVLSGMGSDGTLGIAAIKDRGGAVFVQSPESTKFDAMPSNAIATGLADAVAPPEDLAARVLACRNGPSAPAPTPDGDDDSPSAEPPHGLADDDDAIVQICQLLCAETGQDFSHYKRSTIQRRIERRMGLHHKENIAAYVLHLQENPAEIRLLFKELLIGVTSFFRDPAAWEALRAALAALVASRPAGVLRAWVAGCSTGEEAYSLAILFDEVLAPLRPSPRRTVQIFATDLDSDAIERARLGRYSADIATDVSDERLERYFRTEEHGYRVSQEIRERIIFAVQNLAMDPPFTKLDVVCCRNLLIYLAPDLQREVLPLFHYGLLPGGLLFLGSSETVGPIADAFEPIDAKSRVYKRTERAASALPFGFRQSFKVRETRDDAPASAPQGPNLQTAIERVIIGRHAPPLVLTTLQGDVLYVSGRTGRYLEPAAGRANWNIHAMARDGLRSKLFSGFHQVVRDGGAVSMVGVLPEPGSHPVDVTLERMTEPEALRDTVMITFLDTPAAAAGRPKPRPVRRTAPALEALERELLMTQHAMASTRADMQMSSEHLQSANEELQSTNEELQSTNEELTTSKEEMQSLNEELQTVNAELQSKLDELSRTSDDMRNLLDSTDIATLFLDDTLRVRRFTPTVLKLIKLLPGDLNRPITDLASDLVYPQLVDDAQEVLRTLVFRQTEIATVDARWFSVRIMPYRTLSNRIDGVVITFVDISAAKSLEAELRRERAAREHKPQ